MKEARRNVHTCAVVLFAMQQLFSTMSKQMRARMNDCEDDESSLAALLTHQLCLCVITLLLCRMTARMLRLCC
jgi:hypothetical protein